MARRGRRVNFLNATPSGVLTSPLPSRSGLDLTELEDRRSFYPSSPSIKPVLVLGGRPYRPAVISDRGVRAFLTTKLPTSRGSKFSSKLSFEAPRKVLICVRRHRRRQVLFAKGAAGGRVRRPRRGPFSDISCK